MRENHTKTLRVRPTGQWDRIVEITPQSAGWQYTGFVVHRLVAGVRLPLPPLPRERCVIVLSGIVTVSAGRNEWRGIGWRKSVFEDSPPFAVYLPGGEAGTVTTQSEAEIAVASAPDLAMAFPPRLIEPGEMPRTERGRGTNLRYICDILPATQPAANLLVVEVRTPASHSSSYPPHKHDRDALPEESQLEEIYYHRIDPPSGFAFQRIYTDDRSLDEAVVIEDHDSVVVVRGYHPVVMPHGYRGYYLNVMAGPKRVWRIKNDPAHAWLLGR
jgi:5-deoxy-glucuronate isomerase